MTRRLSVAERLADTEKDALLTDITRHSEWDRFEPSARVVDRFWSRVARGEGCWLWTSATVGKGYGDLTFQRRHQLAHRFAWQLATGRTIPAGRVVRHRCDNPPCVRPDHLELGTAAQNVRDSYERRRRTGNTVTRGTARPNAVLTDELVAEMRRAARTGRSITSIAKALGIAHSTAHRAIRGFGWPHVSEPPVPAKRKSRPHQNHFVRNNPEIVKKARALSVQGLTLQEIANQLGITKTAAYRCCRTQLKETS